MRFLDFFTSNIPNPNTRKVFARGLGKHLPRCAFSRGKAMGEEPASGLDLVVADRSDEGLFITRLDIIFLLVYSPIQADPKEGTMSTASRNCGLR